MGPGGTRARRFTTRRATPAHRRQQKTRERTGINSGVYGTNSGVRCDGRWLHLTREQFVRKALLPGMSLRACYSMSGTGVAYGAMQLCACYAVSGNDAVTLHC
eukprot:3217577-Rhodomonas_salina.2